MASGDSAAAAMRSEQVAGAVLVSFAGGKGGASSLSTDCFEGDAWSIEEEWGGSD